jgi:hypothetical protein
MCARLAQQLAQRAAFSLRFSIAGAHILRYYTMSGWHEPPDTSSLIRL